MSLTGTPKATFLYPRFTYGTVTLDIPEPASRIPTLPAIQGLRGQNVVSTGKAEYLFGRNEEQVGLVLRCEQDMLAALRWAVQDSLVQGTQFKAWVDRFTGSCWLFENNLKDQNGLALTAVSGTPTYAATSLGTGVVLSGSTYLSVALAQASAATPTGYDDPLSKTEGVVVIDFAPGFTGTDGATHMLLDMTGTTNRLRVFKESTNNLALTINDNSGTEKRIQGAVTWSASARVQVVGSWDSAGTLTLAYAVNGGAFTALTSASGAGTGIITTLATTLYIGADSAGANNALGTYDTVAFFKKAFSSPQLSLANYRPLERNHFPYAELITPAFQPARVSLGRTVWDWPITIRNGQP